MKLPISKFKYLDGIHRSMPNLNRIRGRGRAGFAYRGRIATPSGIRGAGISTQRGTNNPSRVTNYGLSRTNNSNSRLIGQQNDSNARMPPPNAIPRMSRDPPYREDNITTTVERKKSTMVSVIVL